MCWACEEEAMWRRYQLELAVERDEIPPWFEPEDFEWAGLPVPSKRAPSSVASADPSLVYSGESGNSENAGPRFRGDERKEAVPSVNPFVCDAPDRK